MTAPELVAALARVPGSILALVALVLTLPSLSSSALLYLHLERAADLDASAAARLGESLQMMTDDRAMFAETLERAATSQAAAAERIATVLERGSIGCVGPR